MGDSFVRPFDLRRVIVANVQNFAHIRLAVISIVKDHCNDGKLPYTALRDGVFAHPTLAESLNNLFMAMDSGK